MNWDYVHGKKNQKENKNKQTKRKQTKKINKIFFIRQFGSVFNKKMVKSVIFSAAPQGIYIISRKCHIIYPV